MPLSPLRRLCSLVVSLAVLSSAAADHADANADGRSGGRADAHPHRADEDAAPPVYLVTGATGRTGSLVYFGLQAAVAAQVAADELGGAYADPNHPGCARSVVALSARAAVVSGADAAADGRSCDGATDVKWGPLAASLDSDAIVVDFSPKGGPADLRGVFDPSVPGIQWADGNVWTKLDGRRHGRSATDGRTAPAVRALVTDLDAAREVLGCTACDASEGIYLGDVTEPDTLDPATDGVTALAIAVGVGGNATEDVMEAVEFRGVQNQVASLAASARKRGAALTSLNVALISSMGTTDPNPAPYGESGCSTENSVSPPHLCPPHTSPPPASRPPPHTSHFPPSPTSHLSPPTSHLPPLTATYHLLPRLKTTNTFRGRRGAILQAERRGLSRRFGLTYGCDQAMRPGRRRGQRAAAAHGTRRHHAHLRASPGGGARRRGASDGPDTGREAVGASLRPVCESPRTAYYRRRPRRAPRRRAMGLAGLMEERQVENSVSAY